MGRALCLLGICVVSCAVLLGCESDSSRVLFPTAATPTAATPTPAPIPTPPPQGTYTVSGVVSEVVDGRTIPLERVHVEDSQRHVFVQTAADGAYAVTEIAVSGGAYMYFAKEGFRSESRRFALTGDTRLDVTLVRQ